MKIYRIKSIALVLLLTVASCTSSKTTEPPKPKKTANTRPEPEVQPKPELPQKAPAPKLKQSLNICSFNIQFLGYSRKRKNKKLADIIKSCDVVAIQELVSPPYPGSYPDKSPLKPDKESSLFFKAMENNGYKYVLSEEDTGTGEKNHKNSSATEWFVTFYKPGKLIPTRKTFLADDRSDHPDYERVPYAFGFRAKDGRTDFILISVHLKPGKYGKKRRKQELEAIAKWIKTQKGKERDYIILGDMNIEDKNELTEIIPTGFKSLNSECLATNTNINGPKPYDHFMVNPQHSSEAQGFAVIDLVKAMGVNKYNHNKFRALYTDHNPVFIIWRYTEDDD